MNTGESTRTSRIPAWAWMSGVWFSLSVGVGLRCDSAGASFAVLLFGALVAKIAEALEI